MVGGLGRPYIVASKPIMKPDDILSALSIDDADFIELRVDYMDRPLEADYSLLRGRRVIVTLREFNEGGAKPHNPNTKIELLGRLRSLGILYDVEVSFIERFGVDYTNSIVSMHFVNSRPNTDYVVEKIHRYRDKAFIVKVVTVPFPGYRSFLVKLLEIGDNISAFPMSVDPLERVAFALLGSKLIYGYVDTPTAKGQLHYKQLRQLVDTLFRYSDNL